MDFSCDRFDFNLILLFLSLSRFYTVAALHDHSSEIECPPSSSSWERVINDLEIIEQSRNGVKVDYNYNETNLSFYSNGENETTSAPGCPKSVDGTPWIYYGDPPRCYFPGYQGPCEFGDVLVEPPPTSNTPFVGICICEWALDDNLFDSMKISRDGKYGFHSEEYFKVFNLETRKCDRLGEQGPCESGQVLYKAPNSNSIKCVLKFEGKCKYNYQTESCEKLHLIRTPIPESDWPAAVALAKQHKCNHGYKYSATLSKCLIRKGGGVGLG